MDAGRVVALDEVRLVAVALHEGLELRLRDAREHRRVGDLVAVQVEDGQDRSVADRVHELVGVPARGQRPRLRLPVADHRAHDEVRVVERGAVGVRQRVPELAPLVDRSRRLGRDVARDPARERELAEQPPHSVLVPGDAGVDLAVRALEIGIGHDRGAAVPGPGDVDRVQVPVPDHPVHVGVDEVQARCRPPVAQQPGLHVPGSQGFAKQRVVQQVDLTDGEVVGGAPVGVDPAQLVLGKWSRRGRCRAGVTGAHASPPVRWGPRPSLPPGWVWSRPFRIPVGRAALVGRELTAVLDERRRITSGGRMASRPLQVEVRLAPATACDQALAKSLPSAMSVRASRRASGQLGSRG